MPSFLPIIIAPSPQKKLLTNRDEVVTVASVKSNSSQVERLMGRIRRVIDNNSAKRAELTNYLRGVPRESISRWLSGKREPGGEATLQLLYWVEQQERNLKQNAPTVREHGQGLKTRPEAQ